MKLTFDGHSWRADSRKLWKRVVPDVRYLPRELTAPGLGRFWLMNGEALDSKKRAGTAFSRKDSDKEKCHS